MVGGGEMDQMTPLISPVDNATNAASLFKYTLVLNLTSSVTKLWYMYVYPKHAMLGMWGNVTVVSPSQVGA